MIKDYVASTIRLPIPANRGERRYSELPCNLGESRIDGLPHIIFIAYYPDPHVLKKALTLRSSKSAYLTLLAGCIREDVGINQYFDQFYEYDHFHDLYQIVEASKPYSWHAVSPIYHPAIVIQRRKKESRLVVDINDPALFVANDPNDDAVRLERAVMQKADFIIHKLPEHAWQILKRSYGLDCGGATVYSYPCSQFTVSPQTTKPGILPHVAYAGGVMPYDIAMARGHENHVFDDLIRLTGSDSFELTIYVNQNARDMPWPQHQRYYNFQNTYKKFHFEKGLPYYKITRSLSKHDAGIFYDNILISSYNMEHFKYNVASKFFTYLEAGIPIVVFEEAETMAEITRRYCLGTTYSARRPSTIIGAIQGILKSSYSESIKHFCQGFPMELSLVALREAHNLHS